MSLLQGFCLFRERLELRGHRPVVESAGAVDAIRLPTIGLRKVALLTHDSREFAHFILLSNGIALQRTFGVSEPRPLPDVIKAEGAMRYSESLSFKTAFSPL